MQSASKTKATQNNYSELKGTYILTVFLSVLNSLILIIFYNKKSYFHFVFGLENVFKINKSN